MSRQKGNGIVEHAPVKEKASKLNDTVRHPKRRSRCDSDV